MIRLVHFILQFIYFFSLASRSDGKTFSACKLVMELMKQGFPEHQLNDCILEPCPSEAMFSLIYKKTIARMCLIEAESSRRTDAIGGPDDDGSFDHGLFQINDRYWCSAGDSPGKGCNVTCIDVLTDDITTASQCAQEIYEQQGFSAWLGWKNECRDKEQHDNYC